MIQTWIALGTVEWCVIVFIAGAAILALVARPGDDQRPAETLFASGTLARKPEADVPDVEVVTADDGRLLIVRRGIEGCPDAVSLAATLRRDTLEITERISGPYRDGTGAAGTSAMFTLGPMAAAAGRLHVVYSSPSLQLCATFGISLRPGSRRRILLRQ